MGLGVAIEKSPVHILSLVYISKKIKILIFGFVIMKFPIPLQFDGRCFHNEDNKLFYNKKKRFMT